MDFLTDNERRNVAKRENIAYALSCGLTYEQIREKYGASANTIALVRRLMDERGYEIIRL